MNNQVPVLLVIFNRPEKTRRVAKALRQVKPARLFVAADGPRPGRLEDIEKCRLARQAATDIDWPCDLMTRFLDENVGCDPSVSGAINWFFEHVAQGAILEDDCVPHPHFFRFCADMFERYADDTRIMQVSGFSPYPDRRHPYDYHFSRFFRCWCWGTWRRAWALYSDSLEQYDSNRSIEQILKSYFPSSAKYRERFKLYREFRLGKRDNWDFKWNIACSAQNALCIVPERNLVTNIGCDKNATHTMCPNPVMGNLEVHPLEFPLRHTPLVYADGRPERSLEKAIHRSLPFKSRCGRRLRHALGAMADFFETMPPIRNLR